VRDLLGESYIILLKEMIREWAKRHIMPISKNAHYQKGACSLNL
jgi:hypothetical protein